MENNIKKSWNIRVQNQAAYISYRRQRTTKVLEYLFWGYLIYSYCTTINIPYLGLGWLVFMALVSFFSADWKKRTRIPMQLTITISGLFLVVQFLIHGSILSTTYIEFFFQWPAWALIIFKLSERPGFIKRLAIGLFAISLYVRLFIVTHMDIVARQQFESGSGLDNSNDYAAWIGFSALVFWLWSWKSTNKLHRFVLLICFAVASFFMLGTVSRGALISLAVGILVGLGAVPKKMWLGTVIILGLAIFLVQVLSTNTIANYQARLYEESGRLSRWPIAVESLQMQPLWGYGLNRVAHKGAGIDITPHNGILLIGLSAGIPIALLFTILWGLAIFHGYRSRALLFAENTIDALPLIFFAFLEMMQANLYFMSVWGLAAMFYCFQDETPDNEEVVLPLVDARPNYGTSRPRKVFR
jgi:O-antigen ligase